MESRGTAIRANQASQLAVWGTSSMAKITPTIEATGMSAQPRP